MTRAFLVVAVIALGMGACSSSHPRESARNLKLASQDKAAEKDCDAGVTIKNGYGQDCTFTREQAGQLGKGCGDSNENPCRSASASVLLGCVLVRRRHRRHGKRSRR
jgi:hypothetical protein